MIIGVSDERLARCLFEAARRVMRESTPDSPDVRWDDDNPLVNDIRDSVLKMAVNLRKGLECPTHRHPKTGGLYAEMARAVDVSNDRVPSKVVVYRGSDGRVWVRLASEFDDGGFVRV